MKANYKGFVIRPFYICISYIFIEIMSLGLVALLAIVGPMNIRTQIDEWVWPMLTIFFALASLMPLWDALWGIGGYLDKRFVIDSNGVMYYTKRKRFYLHWEEIQHIVLYPDRLNRYKKHCFVCFIATRELPICLYDWHDYNETAFGIQYRPELVGKIEEFSGKKVELIDRI